MAEGRNDWELWLEEIKEAPPTATAKLSKVEHRVLDNRTWWSDHRADLREWTELALMRIVTAVVLVFLVGVADVLAPSPRLECLRIVQIHDPSDWIIHCEYTDSSALRQRSEP